MSPVSGEYSRWAMLYSGKVASPGSDVVVVDEVVVVAMVVVVVVVVVVVDEAVVDAGSFDDVHEAATSAAAISRRILDFMVVDSIRLNPRRLAQPIRRTRFLPSMSCR